MDNKELCASFIDRGSLPPSYPTHRHPPQFWEHLGRTIATYGFLEEVLGKAIFAFTMTRSCSDEVYQTLLTQSKQTLNQALEDAIGPTLQHALTDTLSALATAYGKAVLDHPANTIENVLEVVEAIKEAAQIRNVLCHGSWRAPDCSGASKPLFVNRLVKVFDTAIDIAFLRQVQEHIVELSCFVRDSVTQMGWQFPGTARPGRPIVK